MILLTSQQEAGPEARLRRIEVWVEGKQDTVVFVTNNPKLAAKTSACIYRDRWQIDTFFKVLRQGLKLKTFVGTGQNAVQIQIRTALIAMLVLRYLQMKSTFSGSLSNLVALLRQQLSVYRDLWTWLNDPFHSFHLLSTRFSTRRLRWWLPSNSASGCNLDSRASKADGRTRKAAIIPAQLGQQPRRRQYTKQECEPNLVLLKPPPSALSLPYLQSAQCGNRASRPNPAKPEPTRVKQKSRSSIESASEGPSLLASEHIAQKFQPQTCTILR